MDRLLQSIVDALEEGQLKLGYRREAVRLYYPLSSLNALLGASYGGEEMERALARFAAAHRDALGELGVSRKGDRFCIAVPPEGAAYVHAHTDENGFLAELIRTVSRHGATLDDVLAVFRRQSDRVLVTPMRNGEFDYLVRFEDGVPNAYYYCIALEPEHVSYHRFTREDYESFGFEA